eukprot:TRINITY_DN9805_c0_g1_i2.p1 TRINITY_DN9805_c0_g1~~TRINITY_DN9805_c0_g1_i2.p1  ORF type:complete len:198 (+),score=62.77 TRINITY_DN9805_c0_g1_i2:124-717(+)
MRLPECKSMTPVLEVLGLNDVGLNVGRVDCRRQPDPCLDMDIKKNYPSVAVHFEGEGRTTALYDGDPQHADALLSWALNTVHGRVVQISTSTISRLFSGLWFVKLFAPWCMHCREMAGEWRALANDRSLPELSVGEVNCDINEEVCERFQVEGYPTLLLIDHGRIMRYSGERTAHAFAQFVRERPTLAASAHPEDVE